MANRSARFGIWMALGLALTSPSTAQIQRAKLLANDADQADYFGTSVAIDGDWAVIGAPQEDDVAEQSGAAYVFHRVNSTWSQTQKLKAGDAIFGAGFGEAVAIDGGRIVVSAPGDDPFGINAAGSAYVFELVGDTWFQQAKLTASDPAQSVFFGNALGVSGGTIAVGAQNASGVSTYSGVTYVFEGSGSFWIQVARLIPSDAEFGDSFGTAVAIEGSRLVVGASGVEPPLGLDLGAAYVFESPAAGVWIEQQKLAAGDGGNSDYFGVGVAISGQTIFVGAPTRDAGGSNTGAVYAFDLVGSSWVETQRVLALDPVADAHLGVSIDLQGDLALINAHGCTDFGWTSGAAYLMHRGAAGWTQIGKILANDGAGHDLFGDGVGLSGTTAIVGCARKDDACPGVTGCNSGAAYIFDLAPTARQYGSCATLAPCANTDAHGGCRNSTGQGAILQAAGSGSVVSDDLVFEVRHLPPNTSGVLYMGSGQSSTPFGDGQRVVTPGGTGLFRFGVQQANPQGVIVRGPGLVAHSQGFNPLGRISAGQTWNFQFWFRNPAGPCGGFSNLSNGLEVGFTP